MNEYLNNLKLEVSLDLIEELKSKIDYLVNHDIPLLHVLIKYHQPNDRAFIFGDVKLKFSLEDVCNIIGLPIKGKPLPSRNVNGTF